MATSEMSTTSLAPWFGCKRKLAPAILAEIGPHRTWFEPFCGSMAMTFAKEPATNETVNDLHGGVVNLARVVQHDRLSVELFARVSRTLACEALHREASLRHRKRRMESAPATPDLHWATDFFVVSWLGRGGVSGANGDCHGFSRRLGHEGANVGARFLGATRSIPAWHDRLRRVTITNGDGFELLARIKDQPRTTIYCDPPYLVKGGTYVHDFRRDDHARLAELARRFTQARVVISYYDHPELRRLYRGWTFVPIAARKQMVNQGRKGAKVSTVAPEVLIINGDSLAPAPAVRRRPCGNG